MTDYAGFGVQVTRSRNGIIYARAMVSGPFEHELDAQRCRDALAASDGNMRVGEANPDSLWEVVLYRTCSACSLSEGDRAEFPHTCAH